MAEELQHSDIYIHFLFSPGIAQIPLIYSFAIHWTFGSTLEILVEYLSASQFLNYSSSNLTL